MKNFGITTLLLIAYLSLSAQFTWINPLPQGNTLYNIHYAADQLVLACGEKGAMIRSADGGTTWEVVNTPVDKDLHCIHFTSASVGYAGGDSGTIIVTHDGGNSWQAQYSGTEHSLRGIRFLDEETGICCGTGGTLLRTENGGNSWEALASPAVSDCYAMDFVNADTGFIAGGHYSNYGFIMMTMDGGMSWSMVLDSLDNCLNDISCSPAGTVYSGGTMNLLLKSANHGISWDTLPTPAALSSSVYCVRFPDENRGYYSCAGGILCRTDDGGNSWQYEEMGWDNFFYCMDQADGRMLFAGLGGKIYYEDGQGELLPLITGPTRNLHSIQQTDRDHIFICGDKLLITSASPGTGWSVYTFPELEYSSSACFTDSLTGYVLVSFSVYKTSDGGQSWQEHQLNWDADYLSGISMVDNATGFVYGGGVSPGGAHWASMFRTTDGEDWAHINAPGAYWLTACTFHDRSTGFAANYNGEMYKSTDGGDSWSSVALPAGAKSMNDIVFTGESTIYAAGSRSPSGSMILKSNDQGESWKVVYEDSVANHIFQINTLAFYNEDHGYAGGSRGGLLATMDGGDSWMKLSTPFAETINDILLTDDSSGYFVGPYGGIMSFGEPGLGINDQPVSNMTALHAYPNPFAGNIHCDIYSNNAEKVRVSVTGSDGRQVYTGSRMLKRGYQCLHIQLPGSLANGLYILTVCGENIYYSGKLMRRE